MFCVLWPIGDILNMKEIERFIFNQPFNSVMAKIYKANKWYDYVMDWSGDPHPAMEPQEKEIEEVQKALQALSRYQILPHSSYDYNKFMQHRKAVKLNFKIPWTGISPRMQRLIYAINAIVKPKIMIAIGIFCGNTFISNAGAAIGPGACYKAERLIGIEIVPRKAQMALKNVASIDGDKMAEIFAADGVEWLRAFNKPIDLLYIDADGSYYDIIKEASKGKLHSGSIVLAHNSVNFAHSLSRYLDFVRDPLNSIESVNIYIDDQGLEVSLWR
jgi:predicted O-methyltransferase YrrM